MKDEGLFYKFVIISIVLFIIAVVIVGLGLSETVERSEENLISVEPYINDNGSVMYDIWTGEYALQKPKDDLIVLYSTEQNEDTFVLIKSVYKSKLGRKREKFDLYLIISLKGE